MKSQTTYLSYILLTGIAITLIAAAYFWGEPYLRKSKTTSEISGIEDSLNSIAKAVEEVIKTKEERIVSLPGIAGNIYPNKIVFTYTAPVIYYNPAHSIYLNVLDYKAEYYLNETGCYYNNLEIKNKAIIFTKNETLYVKCENGKLKVLAEVGRVGSDPYCIIKETSTVVGKNEIVNFEIFCRPMYDPYSGKCFFIDLIPEGKTGGRVNGIKIRFGGKSIKMNIYAPNCTVIEEYKLYVSFI